MARYQFRLAEPKDDGGIRAVLDASPMAGAIAVRMRREPSFFESARLDGAFRQIAVCEDSGTGRIVGFGTRSVQRRLVNGDFRPVGYLGMLRSVPEVRGRALLGAAFRFLRELHADGRADFYLTTIAEGNDVALRALTSGRAGLPAYVPAGEFATVALPIPRRVRAPRWDQGDLVLSEATMADEEAIMDFLRRVGGQHQFFPDYIWDDLASETDTLLGLRLGDIVIARRAGRLVGMMGAWDQRPWRQSEVVVYSGLYRRIRPLYNLLAPCFGRPGLPAPGAAIHYVAAALPLVAPDEVTALRALIGVLRARLSGGGAAYLMLGMHGDNPLLAVARRGAAATYRTRLFVVAWGEPPVLDGRIPYLELGAL